MYDGVIPENCFIVENQAADISHLRAYLKILPGAHYEMPDSHESYRNDMLAKWNIHTEKLFRMLKKAVSFKPIVNIQQFITENVCDIPDRPDIEEMQQNIQDYKHDEKMTQRQEQKYQMLCNIGERFRTMQVALERFQQQRFITLWAKKEDVKEQLAKTKLELAEADIKIQKLQERIAQLSDKIQDSTTQKEKLIEERSNSDIQRAYNELITKKARFKNERKEIIEKIDKTTNVIKREAEYLCSCCLSIEKWTENENLKGMSAEASALLEVFKPFCNFLPHIFLKIWMLLIVRMFRLPHSPPAF